MIIGYYQRERNGNIYVDLGQDERKPFEKYQSHGKIYHRMIRIKALIYEVGKNSTGSADRPVAKPRGVREDLRARSREIYDKTIEIMKIVREPGLPGQDRRPLDPRGRGSGGARVGLKGVRIQAVVRELEGEEDRHSP